jgi:uncharacterized tellurite resistance protein B-like protein
MTSYTDILNNLYEVLIEANLRNEQTADEAVQENDPEIAKALLLIRRMNVKAKAELNRVKYSKAKELMEEFLAGIGNNIDEVLSKLKQQPENEPIIAFWRNYQNMTESDKASMLLDQKMLEFIGKAKDILKSNESKG